MPYDEYIYIAYNSLFLHCAHALVFMTSRRRHQSSSPFQPSSSHQVRTKRRSRVENPALFTVSVWLTTILIYQVSVFPVPLHFLRRHMPDEKVSSTSIPTDEFRARYFDIFCNIYIHRLHRSSHRRAYLHHIHCAVTFQQLSDYNNLPVFLVTNHHLARLPDHQLQP